MPKRGTVRSAIAAARQALVGMEKATKALQLDIKHLRKALGHPHFAGTRVRGHPHTAR
jgi:regulator of replication initiation timing